MSDQAIQDLAFLAKRLGGIIALKDELTDYQALKKQVAERKGQLDKAAKDLEALQEEQEQEATNLKDLKASVKAAQDKADADLKAQKAAADKAAAEIRAKAEADAAKIVEDAEAQKAVVMSEIEKMNGIVTGLRNEKDKVEDSLNAFKAELAALRAKF